MPGWPTTTRPPPPASGRRWNCSATLGHRRGQANALNGLGIVYRLTGNYPAAAASLQQALELFRDIGHRTGESDALSDLAIVQTLTGDYPAAATTFEQAMALERDLGRPLRAGPDTPSSSERLQRLTGDYRAAAASQQQALALPATSANGPTRPDALNELGLVQQLTGDYAAAAVSHQQALELSRDTGERHGQAEALNSLGELSIPDRGQPASPRLPHPGPGHRPRPRRARWKKHAPWKGSAAAHLQDGHTGEGTAHLRQALAIYQRIGAPDARRVQETLTATAPENTQTPTPKPGTARAPSRSPSGDACLRGQFSTAPVRAHALLAPASQLRQVEMLVERPRCPGPDSRDQVVASLRGTADACEDRQGRPCRQGQATR